MTAADTRPDRSAAAPAAPADRRLPDGFRVRLDRRARPIDGGAALLGGAPPRLVHLSARARELLPPPGGTLVVEGPTHRALARTLLDAGLAHPVPRTVPHAGATGPNAGETRLHAGATGPNAGETGPHAGPAGSNAGATGPHTGATGPNAGETGPHAGPAGPNAGAAGPHAGPGAGPHAGPHGPAEVTVVVPVRDRPLDALLAALPIGELGGLIVVDDGSTEPEPLRRSVEAAGGRVLRHAASRGPAAARNAGLGAARTPFVVFLDSDVVPEPGWLEPLLAHLADPAVGLVAPRIVALDPAAGTGLRGLVGRYEAVRSSLDLGPDPALIVPRSRVAYVPSAAMLVRVAAVGAAAFDPAMHVAEDVDLVLRLHAAGWAMRFEPAARVAHDHRTDPAEWLRRKAFYGTGAAPLALRHPGAVPPMVLSGWTAAVCLLLLARRRGATAVAAVVTAVATDRLSRKLTRLERPRRSAARLTALGLSGALWQCASGLTRHFWPVAALALPFSARARTTVLAAALAEGLADWWLHRDRDPRVRISPVGHLVAHRLDDLAYGAGLWWGAWRHRTTAPLRPTGPGPRR